MLGLHGLSSGSSLKMLQNVRQALLLRIMLAPKSEVVQTIWLTLHEGSNISSEENVLGHLHTISISNEEFKKKWTSWTLPQNSHIKGEWESNQNKNKQEEEDESFWTWLMNDSTERGGVWVREREPFSCECNDFRRIIAKFIFKKSPFTVDCEKFLHKSSARPWAKLKNQCNNNNAGHKEGIPWLHTKPPTTQNRIFIKSFVNSITLHSQRNLNLIKDSFLFFYLQDLHKVVIELNCMERRRIAAVAVEDIA